MDDLQSILLVDDNADDLLLIRRAFQRGRILNPIHTVSDGEEAIAYLSGENQYADRARFPLPALIVLDLRLPRKSGFDVLRWLRAHSELGRLPVVVLTHSESGADIDRAYALGANSYLVKPVSPDALVGLVHAMQLGWMRFTPPPPGPRMLGL